MIDANYFERKAVKSRMMDYAAKEWGYNNAELENFDPIVSLLMSGLAKEIEKSYQSYHESYSRVISKVIEKLIPGNRLDFMPAQNIIHLESMQSTTIVDKENLTLTIDKQIDKIDKELEFVPLLPCKILPVQVKFIADGFGIYSISGVDRFEEYAYTRKDNAIYLGLKESFELKQECNLDLYFDWLNYPAKKSLYDLSKLTKWSIGNKELTKISKPLYEFKDDIEADIFWTAYPFSNKIKSSYRNYKRNIISFENIDFSKDCVPEFISKIADEESALSGLKELKWIKVELPPHPQSKDFAKHLFCQTNCFPFINMKKRRLLKKVKAPFKILKLNTEDHFVDIRSIQNTDGKNYTMHEDVLNNSERAGIYRVISDGVQRINKKQASEAINEILDTIKEERNAFAAQNPDWIADELLEIKKTINRIQGKLNTSSEIKPSDVFIEFENSESEDILTIEYWSSSANEANDISVGTFFEITSDGDSVQSALAITNSHGGQSYIGADQKLKNFQRSLYSRKSIVSVNDIKLFVSERLHQYGVVDIRFNKYLATSQNRSEGYRFLYKVEVDINQLDPFQDISGLERLVEEECNENTILGFEIILKIKRIPNG